MGQFTFVDIVFSLIVLLFAIIVCSKGFIEEIFGKISVIAGIFVAAVFCGRLSPYMAKIISNSTLCVILSFVILFIATFLLVKIIQHIVKGFFSGEILRSLDRVLGFALGFFEGLLVISAVLIIVQAQPWFTGIKQYFNSCFYWNILGWILQKPVTYVEGMFV